MTTRRRWKRLALVIALALIITVLGIRQWSPVAWKKGIRQTVSIADCIIIDPNTVPRRDHLPTIEVNGQEAVEALIGSIEFEPSLLPWHCRCFGEVAIRFCQRNNELMTLTLHHGGSLRVHDANWQRNRNMQLTPSSRAKVIEWLRANGYRPPMTTNTSAFAGEVEAKSRRAYAG